MPRPARPGADLPEDVVGDLCDHFDGLSLAVAPVSPKFTAVQRFMIP